MLAEQFITPKLLGRILKIFLLKRFYFEVYIGPDCLKFEHLFTNLETINRNLANLENSKVFMEDKNKIKEEDLQNYYTKFIKRNNYFLKKKVQNFFDDKIFLQTNGNQYEIEKKKKNIFLYLQTLLITTILPILESDEKIGISSLDFFDFLSNLVDEEEYSSYEMVVVEMLRSTLQFLDIHCETLYFCLTEFLNFFKDWVLLDKFDFLFNRF